MQHFIIKKQRLTFNQRFQKTMHQDLYLFYETLGDEDLPYSRDGNMRRILLHPCSYNNSIFAEGIVAPQKKSPSKL